MSTLLARLHLSMGAAALPICSPVVLICVSAIGSFSTKFHLKIKACPSKQSRCAG